MNDNVKIKLDVSRLYGFKIVQAKNAEKCLTPKIGNGKPGKMALSPKIGSKDGVKSEVPFR